MFSFDFYRFMRKFAEKVYFPPSFNGNAFDGIWFIFIVSHNIIAANWLLILLLHLN